MANRYSAKYIILDTADVQIGGPEATGGPKGPLSILAIKWVATTAKAIANGNIFTLEWGKNGGDIVLACDAQILTTGSLSVFYSAEFGHPGWIVPGLYCEDLTGGELQFLLV